MPHKMQVWIFISAGSIWSCTESARAGLISSVFSGLLEAYSYSWQSVSWGDPRCRQLELPWHTGPSQPLEATCSMLLIALALLLLTASVRTASVTRSLASFKGELPDLRS